MNNLARGSAVIATGAVIVGGAVIPAQAAPAQTPIARGTVALNPAQIRSITGNTQGVVAVRKMPRRGFQELSVEYSVNKPSRFYVIGTDVERGPSPAAVRRDATRALPGFRQTKSTYNPRTASGHRTLTRSYVETVKDANGHDVQIKMFISTSIRYTGRTAVLAMAVEVVPLNSTNFRPSVAKADAASHIVAKRFRVTG